MKKFLFITILAASFAACNQGTTTAANTPAKDSTADKPKTETGLAPGESLYGVAFDHKSPIKLTELMADPSKLDTTKDYAVEAVVTTVCQQKGCWFRAEDGKGGDVFVKIVSDESKEEVGIPMNTPAGGNVIFYGTPKYREVSVKTQRHYLEDAGKSKKEIEAITKPVMAWRFFATGVIVKK